MVSAFSASSNSGLEAPVASRGECLATGTRDTDEGSWAPVSQFPSLHFLLGKFLLENDGYLGVAYFNIKEGSNRERRKGEKEKKRLYSHWEEPGSRGQVWVPILTLAVTNLELRDKPLNLSKLHQREIIISLISWGCPKGGERYKLLGTEPTMWKGFRDGSSDSRDGPAEASAADTGDATTQLSGLRFCG